MDNNNNNNNKNNNNNNNNCPVTAHDEIGEFDMGWRYYVQKKQHRNQ